PALRVLHQVAVANLHRPLEARFEERLVDHLRGAADVEGPHGELGARLADRLRRDDADRLAEIDRRTPGSVPSVPLGADAVRGPAGQDRADTDRLDAALLDLLDVALLDELAGRHDDLAGRRRHHVLGGGPSEDALAEGGDDLTGIDDRLHLEAGIGAAV